MDEEVLDSTRLHLKDWSGPVYTELRIDGSTSLRRHRGGADPFEEPP